MKMTERLIELKSSDFSVVFTSYIESLHREQGFDFCDVTLVSDDDVTFQAHKILLSSQSQFLRSILKKHVHAHPLIYLHGINSSQLGLILDYIYKGKVQLSEDQLNGFLDVAEKLKITKLTQNISSGEDIKQALNPTNTVRRNAVNDGENKGASSICELDQKNAQLFLWQEKSHPSIRPLTDKTNTSPKYLDFFHQSVSLSKQNNQAKKIKLVKPKVESNTNINENYAQSQAPEKEKKSEVQKDRQHEEILMKDLISMKGSIFVCKRCGQKSKNQDFIMKHVGTHLKEIMQVNQMLMLDNKI